MLRRIASDFENYRAREEFTCIMVERLLGRKVRDRYADMFDLEDHRISTLTARSLWSMPEGAQRDMRVLMLCFAAAMGL